MLVGVPKEVKNHEYRVAITPAGVHELVRAWSRRRSSRRCRESAPSITDDEFVAAGAKILPTADDVWAGGRPDPQGQGADRRGVRPDAATEQVLFTYLHLAASRECTDALLDAAGHRDRLRDRADSPTVALPLLAPMSEVAGRLAPQVGALPPDARHGGRGVLLGGVSGVYAGEGRGHRRRRLRHERRGDRPRHAGGGAAPRPRTSSGCARPTGSTRATCRPSRPTATRSSGRCSTPTW